MKGYSLIEILLYVAILSMIAVVLANYLSVSLAGRAEHSARDDIRQVEDDLQLALNNDIASAAMSSLPSPNSTSSTLILSGQSGTTTWSVSGAAMLRTTASDSRTFGGTPVRILNVVFTDLSVSNIRLNATTTKIEYHMDLSHSRENLKRTFDGAGVLGKQGL